MLPELLPGLLMLKDRGSWTGLHSRRTGYALRVPAAGVLALVDPPPLGAAEGAQLEALGPPTHVVLTCNWHLRGGEDYRRRWGCPILAHEAGRATAEVPLDGTFRDGERLWGAVEALHLPELGWPEEVALLVRVGEPARCALIVGDAVCGGRGDVRIPEGEVGNYAMSHSPEEVERYIPDLPRAHCALERLLEHDFEVLAFGHGAPVLATPHAALRRFLARDDLWGAAARGAT